MKRPCCSSATESDSYSDGHGEDSIAMGGGSDSVSYSVTSSEPDLLQADPDEDISLFPKHWLPRYLERAGITPMHFVKDRPLKVFGACEGAGTLAYVMKHVQEQLGVPVSLGFTSESDAKAREWNLQHFEWEHLWADCNDELETGLSQGHCFVCEKTHRESTEDDYDLAVMGVPCPIYSALNMKTHREDYNPLTEADARVTRGCLRKLRLQNPRSFVIEEVAGILRRFKKPLVYHDRTYEAPIDFFLRGEDDEQAFGVELPKSQSDPSSFTPYFVKVLKLQSKDFGSPNCRKRVYIIGVRKDMVREMDFKCMITFIELKCTAVHRRCTLRCCWDYCQKNRVPMTCPPTSQDSRTIRTSASAEKIRRVQDALNIPTDGTDGPYTSTLQPGVLSQLNSREREKLDIEFGRLKVRGNDPMFATVDLARSSASSMGSYPYGVGAAFSTHMKLFDLGRQEWCPAQAIFAAQGFDPKEFLFADVDYKMVVRMAGNSMTTSVLGAAVMGILIYALPLSQNFGMPLRDSWCDAYSLRHLPLKYPKAELEVNDTVSPALGAESDSVSGFSCDSQASSADSDSDEAEHE